MIAQLPVVVLVGAAPAVFVGAAVTLLHLSQAAVPASAPALPVPATPPATPPQTVRSPRANGTGAAALRALVAAEVPAGDRRSVSELARTLGPRAGLRESSARRVIAAALSDRDLASGARRLALAGEAS